MLLKNAIKKLEKELETKVIKEDLRSYYVKANGYFIELSLSYDLPETKEEALNCDIGRPRVRRSGDISDTQSDYFAGYYAQNLSQAIRAVKELNK